MDNIIAWLSATRASAFISNIPWVIPAVQTVHILAICVVMSSVLLLNLRLIGAIGGGEPKDVFTRRYLPWVWVALGVLFVSGSTLVVGEPNRDLVQEIRGQTYICWFGVMVGALIAFYALNASLPLCLLAALLGGLVFWPISRCFS